MAKGLVRFDLDLLGAIDGKLCDSSVNNLITGTIGEYKIDVLFGSFLEDSFIGGPGAGVFKFEAGWGADTIEEYVDGIDKISNLTKIEVDWIEFFY